MKRSKRTPVRKLGLLAAVVAVLLIAAGCGAGSRDPADPHTADPASSIVTTAAAIRTAPETEEPLPSSPETEETAPSDPETEEVTASVGETEEEVQSTRQVLGVISEEEERLNRFLTGFVQQEVLDTRTELDEDEELVRFVFRYLRTNDPQAVLEQEDGGTPCRTLTLEQVNETLNKLLGKTIAPDREDYSILTDGEEEFRCVFHDGVFWHSAPYHTFAYGFPVRFALVERIDEETNTLHFRFYKVNPVTWEIGEADRHIPLLPLMSFLDAERGPEILKLGEGDAVLRDLSEELQLEDLQLVEYVITMYH